MNIVYIDFETGDLEPSEGAEPVELAAIMLHPDTLEEISRWGPVRMRVLKPENLNPKALEVNLRTVADIQAGEDPRRAATEFAAWVVKHSGGVGGKPKQVQLAAHNIAFDKKFMESFLGTHLHPQAFRKLFHYHTYCTMMVANMIRMAEKKKYLDKAKAKASLVNLSESLGLAHDAHTAMGDVEVGVAVLRHVAAWIRSHETLCFPS